MPGQAGGPGAEGRPNSTARSGSSGSSDGDSDDLPLGELAASKASKASKARSRTPGSAAAAPGRACAVGTAGDGPEAEQSGVGGQGSPAAASPRKDWTAASAAPEVQLTATADAAAGLGPTTEDPPLRGALPSDAGPPPPPPVAAAGHVLPEGAAAPFSTAAGPPSVPAVPAGAPRVGVHVLFTSSQEAGPMAAAAPAVPTQHQPLPPAPLSGGAPRPAPAAAGGAAAAAKHALLAQPTQPAPSPSTVPLQPADDHTQTARQALPCKALGPPADAQGRGTDAVGLTPSPAVGVPALPPLHSAAAAGAAATAAGPAPAPCSQSPSRTRTLSVGAGGGDAADDATSAPQLPPQPAAAADGGGTRGNIDDSA